LDIFLKGKKTKANYLQIYLQRNCFFLHISTEYWHNAEYTKVQSFALDCFPWNNSDAIKVLGLEIVVQKLTFTMQKN